MDFAISRLLIIGLRMLLPQFFSKDGGHVKYNSIGLVRFCLRSLQMLLEQSTHVRESFLAVLSGLRFFRRHFAGEVHRNQHSLSLL